MHSPGCRTQQIRSMESGRSISVSPKSAQFKHSRSASGSPASLKSRSAVVPAHQATTVSLCPLFISVILDLLLESKHPLAEASITVSWNLVDFSLACIYIDVVDLSY